VTKPSGKKRRKDTPEPARSLNKIVVVCHGSSLPTPSNALTQPIPATIANIGEDQEQDVPRPRRHRLSEKASTSRTSGRNADEGESRDVRCPDRDEGAVNLGQDLELSLHATDIGGGNASIKAHGRQSKPGTQNIHGQRDVRRSSRACYSSAMTPMRLRQLRHDLLAANSAPPPRL